MNKSEIQERIAKIESELATLKADLAKRDCTDGIEQEKCWHAIDSNGDVRSLLARTRQDCKNYFSPLFRPVYMPECRQVTAEDAQFAVDAHMRTPDKESMARELHKLGFRMKVQP